MGGSSYDGEVLDYLVVLPLTYFLPPIPQTVLRKQARSLENEIDLKLVAFSKIGAGSGGGGSGGLGGVDTSPLLGEHVFDSLSEEIEQMLEKVGYGATQVLEWYRD